MNKRIKKKNDIVRMNEMLIEAIELIDEYMSAYAHLIGRENHHNADDDFWSGYDKWNKSISGHRTWKSILKKNNIPKYIGKK